MTNRLLFILFVGLLQLYVVPPSFAKLASTQVSFFSENITLQYDDDLFFESEIKPNQYNRYTNKSHIETFYDLLSHKNYHILLDDLLSYKEKFQLNDWLFYELMQKSTNVIFYRFPKNHRTLINWFLLSKAGYDPRITYMNDALYLNIYTKDQLFEVPIIEEKGKPFANLTSLNNKNVKALKMLYIAKFIPNPEGRPFSFQLNKIPLLSPTIITKNIHFETFDNNYSIEVKYDETLIRIMQRYPFVAENQYLEIPMSHTLLNSLVPAFRSILKEKNWRESLEIITAFTRTAFAYKTDEEIYGRSKPMVAEEVFHYPFSDCEDRSALYCALLMELMDFPVIAIAYPDHVTVAVATPVAIGNQCINYGNEEYYVCDPTGPLGSFIIGEIPEEYQETTFEILTSFPKKSD